MQGTQYLDNFELFTNRYQHFLVKLSTKDYNGLESIVIAIMRSVHFGYSTNELTVEEYVKLNNSIIQDVFPLSGNVPPFCKYFNYSNIIEFIPISNKIAEYCQIAPHIYYEHTKGLTKETDIDLNSFNNTIKAFINHVIE